LGGTGSNELYPRATISVLPDGVLLEIFVYLARHKEAFYWSTGGLRVHEIQWRTLVRVCKQWRYIVFASPRGLDLRLYCTNIRPVKKLLNIWPPFPVYIYAYHHGKTPPLRGVTNIIAALKEHNRVCGIYITGVPDSLLKRIAAIKSLPALEQLILVSSHERAPVLPDSFLRGTAPHLRTLQLQGIPFPGLEKLLLSTAYLVNLYLFDIPQS
jgi:hypothetical protein